jgi:GTP-binding protein EngB required for normal cell division
VSTLVEGARRLVTGRGDPSLADRVTALQTAAAVARGRLDDVLVDRAEDVVRRASGRLALTGDHTVVALAGATGSGKSSTFNALAGSQLAQAGVRRPTTSSTSAVVFGDDAPDLLEWLEVPRRHRVQAPQPGLEGLVLLDLPDHDSTQVAHHLEVDRLVQLVDMLVWVLDPQKYADAALHERYLRPLATHREVMIVALNHIDEVPHGERAALLADLRRLLEGEGLSGVPVLGTSARDGDGIPELRSLVAEKVRAKKAVAARLTADVAAAAGALATASGSAEPPSVERGQRDLLVGALAEAAAVPTVVRAVERSVAQRGSRHTGWLPVAWLSRLKPDPLKRLHLDLGSSGGELTSASRASVPEPTRVQRARVDTAVRAVADQVGSSLAPPWVAAVRRASTSRLEDLGDALDRAVVTTDLGADRTPLWWRVSRFLQVLFAVALVGGLLWLGALAVLGYLQLPELATPRQYGVPTPTWLVVGGAVGGLVLALVARVVNRVVARRRSRAADRRLRQSIGSVADHLVIGPVTAELQDYRELRRALEVARR